MDILDRDEFDLEFGFLIVLLLFSSWILLQGFAYSETTRLYPVVTSISVIALSGIILINKLFPSVFAGKIPLFREHDLDQSIQEVSDAEVEQREVNEGAVVYLALYFGVYLASIVYIGFIVSSMGLMYVVQRHFGYKDWKFRVAMTAIMGLLVIVGSLVVGIPLTHGEVLDWLM